ncbi:MAG: ATP-binding protein [Cyclobacteriaceae bacterium]|nr:ATP-binding protein [Cyclobacteriaceae bacterium]
MGYEKKDRSERLLAAIILLIIFLLDVWAPLGVAVGVLYVSSIFLVAKEDKITILAFAGFASVLTVLLPLFTLTDETTWMAFVNRGISLLAIWIAGLIAIRLRVREEKSKYIEQIEAKNRELEQFAYVASHDLREPLQNISGLVGILEQKYKDQFDASGMQLINYLSVATNRMIQLVKGLLDYSRLGKSNALEHVDSNVLISEVQEDLNAVITESGAKVIVGDLPTLKVYRVEFRQLIQNLLSNAIKYRRKKVPLIIDISAGRHKDYWLFSVCDNGIGIEEGHTDRIFEIFKRLHTRQEIEGVGLGLAQCKKITELHGGKIWVESVPGQGSTFFFTIADQLAVDKAEL